MESERYRKYPSRKGACDRLKSPKTTRESGNTTRYLVLLAVDERILVRPQNLFVANSRSDDQTFVGATQAWKKMKAAAFTTIEAKRLEHVHRGR